MMILEIARNALSLLEGFTRANPIAHFSYRGWLTSFVLTKNQQSICDRSACLRSCQCWTQMEFVLEIIELGYQERISIENISILIHMCFQKYIVWRNWLLNTRRNSGRILWWCWTFMGIQSRRMFSCTVLNILWWIAIITKPGSFPDSSAKKLPCFATTPVFSKSRILKKRLHELYSSNTSTSPYAIQYKHPMAPFMTQSCWKTSPLRKECG